MFWTGCRVNCAGSLIFMAPHGFASPFSQNSNKFSWGEHNREVLCSGNCCITKYSTESAVAGARLICPSRKDYKARAWQCPAEPLLTLRRESWPHSETLPKFIILSLIPGTASVSGQSITAPHFILAPLSVSYFASSPQPSEALYPVLTVWTVSVMKVKVMWKSTCLPGNMSFFLCFRRHTILSENSLTEEASREEQPPRRSAVFQGSAERSRGPVISVPGGMLRNIRQYRENFETYLRVVAHEAVGSFDPWAVADR